MKPATWARQLPWSIAAIATVLMIVGHRAIARADELAGFNGRFQRQQALWIALAIALMLVISLPSYRVLGRYSFAAYGGALLLLVAVFFFPRINGAHRWLRLGPVGLQPSELAKLAFVLVLARYLMYRTSFRRLRGLAIPLLIALVPALLILREPDLGTAMVFVPLVFLMLSAAGARAADLAKLAMLGTLVLPLLWSQMSREQRSRVRGLLEQNGPGERPTADGYHLHQAKQMLALGGLWGSAVRGNAVEDRAVYHLPEAQTDFIFCVVGERFGLWGTGGVLALYAALVWRGFSIAIATREPFGRLVATGLTGLFAIEVLINVAMTVGLAPITGLSLPLVSYGGSGLLVHAMALGLLLSVAVRPGYEVTKEPFRWTAGDANPRAVPHMSAFGSRTRRLTSAAP